MHIFGDLNEMNGADWNEKVRAKLSRAELSDNFYKRAINFGCGFDFGAL